jgi:hypothetical protein
VRLRMTSLGIVLRSGRHDMFTCSDKTMNTQSRFAYKQIAPCGMNCGICMAYLREKNHCPGCRVESTEKAKSCQQCIIMNCDKRSGAYCFSCESFPCKRLKQLDKRYRTKYGMSMLENLNNIKEHGIRAFLKNEIERWSCADCGGIINVHKHCCSACGAVQE